MTADISSSPQPNLFAIPPPDLSGSGFGDLVVDNKGVPLGQNTSSETVSTMLGYSNKDTIGPALQDVIEMATMLNLGLSIPRGTVEQSILVYLDTLDPSTPGLPPIKTLLVILQRDLMAGKLGNTQLQEKSDTQSQTTTQETATYNKNVKETQTSQAAVDQQDTGDTSGPSADQTTDDTITVQTTFQLNAQPPLAGAAGVQTNTTPGAPTSVSPTASTEDQLNAIKNNIDRFSDTNVNPNLSAVAVNVGKTSGGNKFLEGNAYVEFLIAVTV
jgi:hypothetical protein